MELLVLVKPNIRNNAFDGCINLTSLTLPESIGDYAFRGCKLTSVNIPYSATSIGNYAFTNNTNNTIGYYSKLYGKLSVPTATTTYLNFIL